MLDRTITALSIEQLYRSKTNARQNHHGPIDRERIREITITALSPTLSLDRTITALSIENESGR
jgi:hypothetical protein